MDNLNALSPLVPWHQALPLVIGAVLQGLALLLGILLAFVVLKFVVKHKHFPNLTLLVALGAVDERHERPSGTDAGVRSGNSDLGGLHRGSLSPLAERQPCPAELLRPHLSALEAEAKALDDIDLKDLPSARSMDAVVAARGAAHELLASARHAVDASVPVNID